ncbi:hypothetical protein Cni_G16003 [Canna indica]|uniref:Uncharacterized protein n=1 Tax=Canna indica TaxID=4628 RepID=A0AAQ3KEK9_9LILI|nr:hypothetical protein Cni_G16003 [Canna indica]
MRTNGGERATSGRSSRNSSTTISKATIGPCNVPKPRAWNPVEHSKWTRTVDGEVQDSEGVGLQVEDDITDEVHLYNSPEDELEVFDLRIIHRKNGFMSRTLCYIVNRF